VEPLWREGDAEAEVVEGGPVDARARQTTDGRMLG